MQRHLRASIWPQLPSPHVSSKVVAPCGMPSPPCGVYSTAILLNEKLTRSRSVELPLSSPASTSSDMTRPSWMVILKYSTFDVPVLRSVRIPSLITSLVRSALINAVDALSTFLTIRSSRMVALPVAVPPPSADLPCMPHDQLRTSIAPLCVSSCASPAIWPCLAPLTLKNMSPAPGVFDELVPGATSVVLYGYASFCAFKSYLKWMPASSEPSAFCGLYSTATF